MAQQSKYSDQQINTILQDMVAVLEKHQVSKDLALMILGNMTTHILTTQFGKAQAEVLADAFANALRQSLKK